MTKLHEKISRAPPTQNSPVTPQGAYRDSDDIKKIQTDLTSQISGIEEKINETDTMTKTEISHLSEEIQDIRKGHEINETSTRERLDGLEKLISALSSNDSTPPPGPLSVPQPPAEEDVSDLKLFVLQTVEAAKDLVRSPLSVMFDAVRSEDFVGEDNFMTFSKVDPFSFNTTRSIIFFSSDQHQSWRGHEPGHRAVHGTSQRRLHVPAKRVRGAQGPGGALHQVCQINELKGHLMKDYIAG